MTLIAWISIAVIGYGKQNSKAFALAADCVEQTLTATESTG